MGAIPFPDALDAIRIYGDVRLLLTAEFEETWKSLLAANIAVYPAGLLFMQDLAIRVQSVLSYQMTLRTFADATGGSVCSEDHGLRQCLNESIDDSRSYYMLSYALKADDRKSGWRNLKVKVAGEHGDVRARTRFYYEGQTTPKPVTPHQDEIKALASPLAATGVKMSVRVLQQFPAMSNNSGGEVRRTTQFLITVPLEA